MEAYKGGSPYSSTQRSSTEGGFLVSRQRSSSVGSPQQDESSQFFNQNIKILPTVTPQNGALPIKVEQGVRESMLKSYVDLGYANTESPPLKKAPTNYREKILNLLNDIKPQAYAALKVWCYKQMLVEGNKLSSDPFNIIAEARNCGLSTPPDLNSLEKQIYIKDFLIYLCKKIVCDEISDKSIKNVEYLQRLYNILKTMASPFNKLSDALKGILKLQNDLKDNTQALADLKKDMANQQPPAQPSLTQSILQVVSFFQKPKLDEYNNSHEKEIKAIELVILNIQQKISPIMAEFKEELENFQKAQEQDLTNLLKDYKTATLDYRKVMILELLKAEANNIKNIAQLIALAERRSRSLYVIAKNIFTLDALKQKKADYVQDEKKISDAIQELEHYSDMERLITNIRGIPEQLQKDISDIGNKLDKVILQEAAIIKNKALGESVNYELKQIQALKLEDRNTHIKTLKKENMECKKLIEKYTIELNTLVKNMHEKLKELADIGELVEFTAEESQTIKDLTELLHNESSATLVCKATDALQKERQSKV